MVARGFDCGFVYGFYEYYKTKCCEHFLNSDLTNYNWGMSVSQSHLLSEAEGLATISTDASQSEAASLI